MKRKVLAITLAALLALLLGVGGATGQEPEGEVRPQGEISIAAAVNSQISYQGILKEGGSPVTGERDMTFRLYSNSTCSTQVGDDILMPGVTVTEGLFSLKLDVDQWDFDGQGLWLGGDVGNTGTNVVCEEILPAPYALSLRPGADIIGGVEDAAVIHAHNTTTSGDASGVYGESDSHSGWGVYGHASAASGIASGVYGRSSSTDGRGVHGWASASSGTTYGVYGSSWSTSGRGVYGEASVGSGTNYGVYGRSYSTDGRGVMGYASATSGTRNGVRGAVYGTGYGLYSEDDLYVAGSCTGCTTAFIARNTSGDTLRVGDVVAASGVGPVLQGHTSPVLQVRRATVGDASVLGVVYMRGEFYAASGDQPEDDDSVHPVEGDVAPGDYLLVVTSGLAQVRVTPGLTPGQRLTVGDTAGLATLAGADTQPGLVFGRAMEAQPDENGLLWAMIGVQ
jgi:hypothetical protein